MTKRQLRNHCARLLGESVQDPVLFMDKKEKDLYAAFFMPEGNPNDFHLALVRSANSKTPEIHVIDLLKSSK